MPYLSPLITLADSSSSLDSSVSDSVTFGDEEDDDIAISTIDSGPTDSVEQRVIISNTHYASIPDGFAAQYEVVLSTDGGTFDGEYKLNGGVTTAYSDSITFSLAAGESAEIWVESTAFIDATVRETGCSSSSLLISDAEITSPMDDSVLAFYHSAKTVYIVLVNWNDNHDAASERPSDVVLNLFSLVGGSDPQNVMVSAADVDKISSYNTWQFAYELPACNIDGDALTYTAQQETTPSGYETASAVDGAGKWVITNTKLMTLQTTIVWNDGENANGTRPTVAEYKDYLTLYQDNVAYALDAGMIAIDSSSVGAWNLSIDSLVQYASDGTPYTYKLVQNTLSLRAGHTLANADEVVYTTAYKNLTNYAALTDAAYSGGTIINGLAGPTTFVGHKMWQDDGAAETIASRPSGTYQLYRYSDNNSNDYTEGSPVSKMTMTLDKTVSPETSTDIDFGALYESVNSGAKLERFDEDGVEYVYFVKEMLSSDSRYTKYFVNNGGLAGNHLYLFNGGTIQNRRTGTVSLTATKIWQDMAHQTLDKSVTLALQKKLSDDSWETVATKTLNGFIAELMKKTTAFSQPAFSDSGLPLEYRVVESEVTVGENTKTGLEDKTSFHFDNAHGDFYNISVEKSGNAYTITNALNGTINLLIKKVWVDQAPESNTTITFTVYQNDVDITASLPAGSTTVMTGNRLSSADAWELLIEVLPKYDDKGAPYEYSVKESTVSGYWVNYSYDNDATVTPNVITATVTNHAYTSGGPTMFAYKRWLDDGDETSRRNLTIGLFKVGDDTLLNSVTLTKSNNWEAYIGFPAGSYDSDTTTFDAAFYANYYLKEIYATVNSLPVYVTYGAEGTPVGQIGTLKTDTSLYQYEVTTDAIGSTSNRFYRFTNLRVGQLNIVAQKSWVDGGNKEDTRSPIVVTVTRAEAGFTPQSVTLDGKVDANGETAAWQAVFTGLTKYDMDGALYNYDVSEAFEDPAKQGDYRISASLDTYVVGNDHTDDLVTYHLTNTLSNTLSSPIVHKIWMDNGTERRPDIYFQVYRSYNDVEYEPMGYIEHRWDTTDPYHWICTFSNLPEYTSQGFKITYYVKEVMPISGLYKTHYYSESPTGDDFSTVGKTELTNYAPMGGTAVNRLEDTRNINGIKIWTSVPSSLAKTDYPKATVTLQYKPYTSDSAGVLTTSDAVNYLIGGAVQQCEIAEGATTFAFEDLPRYDAFGRIIQYILKEESIDGYIASEPQVGYFTLNNTYSPSSVTRTIYGVKSFSGDALSGLGSSIYPEVSLNLYRQMQKQDGSLLGTREFHKTITVTLRGSAEASGFFYGDYSETVPKFAPNGQPYVWSVREQPINGYTVTPATEYNQVPDEGASINKVDLLNDYTGGDTVTVKGTKTWSDGSNTYNTRPDDMVLTLERRAGMVGSWESVTGSTYSWNKSASTNTWTYEFTAPVLKKYAPDGTTYDYRVTEAAVTGYTASSLKVKAAPNADVPTDYIADFVNTLNTTTLRLTKSWKYSDGTSIPATGNFGLRGSNISLTYQLERSTDGVAFDLLTAKTVSLTATTASWSDLPRYDRMTGEEYQYRAREISMANATTGTTYSLSSNVIGAYTVTYGSDTYESDANTSTSTVTNTAELTKVYLQSEWSDQNNQDGVRPATSISYTVKDQNGNSRALTLNKPTAVQSTDATKWPVLPVTVPKYALDGTTLKIYSALQTQPAKYTTTSEISEAAATAYPTSSPDGKLYSFTNTHTTDVIGVSVQKNWTDYGYDTDYRPASVEAQLESSLNTGVSWSVTGSAVTLNSANNWHDGWSALPARVNSTYTNVSSTGTSQIIRYRASEVGGEPTGYLTPTVSPSYVSISNGTSPQINIGNMLDTINFSVKKLWDDRNEYYHSRPENLADGKTSVTVALQRKTASSADSSYTTINSVNLETAADEYESETHRWENIPRIAPDGEIYNYRVKEIKISDSDVTYNNADTLTGGETYNYSVSYGADSDAGDDIFISITNTVQERDADTALTVKKVWNDNSDQDGVRPDTISIKLFRDGSQVQTVSLNEAGDWSHTFTDLPKYKNGSTTVESEYTVSEELGSDTSYSLDSGAAVWDAGSFTYTFNNRYDPKTMTVKATKVWAGDGTGLAGVTRPESIALTLKVRKASTGTFTAVTTDQSGAALTNPVTVTAAGSWADVSWMNLPQRRDGELLEYQVTEAAVPGYVTGYSTAVSGTGTSGEEKTLIVTNTLQKLSYTAQKVWQDASGATLPDDVTVALYRKTALTGYALVVQPNIVATQSLTATGSWSYTWSDLLKYDASGNLYSYAVRETKISGVALDADTGRAAGYELVSEADNATTHTTTITNRLLRHSVQVNKTWNHYGYDIGVEKITVQLQRYVGGVWTDVGGKTMDINVGTASTAFANIQTYDLSGSAYAYRAIEKSLTLNGGTVVNVVLDDDDNPLEGRVGAYRFVATPTGNTTAITNTLMLVDISGSKIWADDSNYNHLRPDNLALTIKNGGVALSPQPTINWPTKSGNVWQYTVEGLPRYNPDGTSAVYTVSETVPTGYTATAETVSGSVSAGTGDVTGANLQNALSTFTISGTKTWDDQSDLHGFRPSGVALTVLYDGTALAIQPKSSQIVWDTSGGNTWSYTISGLPRPASAADAGKYSVKETAITGYSTAYTAGTVDPATYSVSGMDITNTIDTGTLAVEKQTQDAGAETSFYFKAYYKNLHDEWVLYTGAYTLTDTDGNDTLETTDAQGVIILHGADAIVQESAMINNYPARQYRIDELTHTDFNLTAVVNETGTLSKGGTATARFTNAYSTRIKIDNATINPADSTKSDVGGKVAVVDTAPADADPEALDGVDYQDNQIAVAWIPDIYYTFGRSFTVSYRGYGATDFSQITVMDYIDESGSLKPIGNAAYDGLRAVYPEAEISRNSEGAVYLKLADSAESLPPQTSVAVNFLPTLAVENTTAGNLGGTVKVEGGVENNRSDGVPTQDGHARYAVTTVYGSALRGYQVDLKNLTIGLPTTSNGDTGSGNAQAVKLTLDTNGGFTASIPARINGILAPISVSGQVTVIGNAKSPTGIRIDLNALSIALDIGIPFFYQSDDSDDDTSSSENYSNGGGDKPAPTPTPMAQEEQFWNNVNQLIEKALPGDTVKVNANTFNDIPQSVYDMLQNNPDIMVEVTLSNGQIRTLGAVDISGNPTTGGIWEVSVPGSPIIATSSNNVMQPAAATSDIFEGGAGQTIEHAATEDFKKSNMLKALSGWGTFVSLIITGLAYFHKKPFKKKRSRHL
ncbi:MAG TPA: Cna B-type domain-containing protein [Clostridia bacterium]|nr:Cna B-type domain-containing protein [Clostridia bacterium]